MIDKICAEHPELNPLIFDSGNQTHAASARCAECDRFLGWIGKIALVAHLKELEIEVGRVKSLLRLAGLKNEGGDELPIDG